MAGTEARPDPKPAARVRLSPYRYRLLVDEAMLRARGLCECGCGRPADSAHHVIGGSGRSDVLENLMVLAGDGTRLCHGAITSEQRTWDPYRGVYVEPADVKSGIRRRMETVRLDVLGYVLTRKGRDWLDLRYPQDR